MLFSHLWKSGYGLTIQKESPNLPFRCLDVICSVISKLRLFLDIWVMDQQKSRSWLLRTNFSLSSSPPRSTSEFRRSHKMAKLQFMVFQKYCSEKSEMHYWYIIHDIKEISEKILKFQQCVPSQSPTNLSICCHLVYQCLCTEKKITQFKWKFVKTLPIIYLY